MSIGKEYLKVVLKGFESTKALGDKTIEQLSEDDLHWQFNEESNSVAVIVKHLSGNMISRWTDFLTSDGEKPNRNRDEEFEDTISSKEALIALWEQGWHTLLDTLRTLREEDLVKTIYIRSEAHTVMEAIERQMAHYAYHVGQIVYIGKQLKNREWQTLSIPRGQSEQYLVDMQNKHQEK